VKNAAEAAAISVATRKFNDHGLSSGRTAVGAGQESRVRCRSSSASRDNGSGVPEDLLPNLFDPLSQPSRREAGSVWRGGQDPSGDYGGIIECESSAKNHLSRAATDVQFDKTFRSSDRDGVSGTPFACLTEHKMRNDDARR